MRPRFLPPSPTSSFPQLTLLSLSRRIDIGLDTSSYALQSAAIDNLFLDPARQRAHNATQVAAIQHAYNRSGIVPSLREWALQGTELREHIVPSSQPSPPSAETVDPLRSYVLRQNQLINSWIERYRRDDPIELPGDPDLGLNASQTKAIAMALGDKLSLIQGVRPPLSPFLVSFCCDGRRG